MNPRPPGTIYNHRLARRWRTAVAIALSAALGLTGTVAHAADIGDDEPGEVAAVSAAPTGRVVEFPMNLLWTNQYSEYGNPYGYEPRIIIGLDTRTVVLDVDSEPLGPVSCIMFVEFADLPLVTWTKEEWSSDAPKTLPVPEGFVRDGEVGPYVVSCYSGLIDKPSWSLKWHLLNQGEDAGEVVVVTQDADLIGDSQNTYRYNTLGAARPVAAGDTVRLSGPPGTWTPSSEADINLYTGRQTGQVYVIIRDVYSSADGSTVEFTMPGGRWPAYFRPGAYFDVSVRSMTYDPTLPNELQKRHTELTSWRAPLVYVGAPVAPAATVAVTLNVRYALSFQRRVATAVVTATGSSALTGTVTYQVNGKSVGTVTLTAADKGTASFRLPALPKGRYSITAIFTPDTGTPTAPSPEKWLRVLR